MADAPNTPQPPEPAGGPLIGVDEWVSRSAERILGRSGLLGRAETEFLRVPGVVRFVALGGLAALIPVITSDTYLIRVATVTLVFALLALGLNVAVGFAGLLDLGY